MAKKKDVKIWAKYQNCATEEIDTAPTCKEASHLVSEYAMAYGQGWRIWYGDKKPA